MQSKEWQVHLIRNGQDLMGNPTFTYARDAEEVGRYRRKSIGDGLMSHVSRIGMAEDLQESGLTIRMSLRSLGEGSQKLKLVCRGDDSRQVDHVFCSDHPDEMGTIRFFSFNCSQSIPKTIWIKVTELDEKILAQLNREGTRRLSPEEADLHRRVLQHRNREDREVVSGKGGRRLREQGRNDTRLPREGEEIRV